MACDPNFDSVGLLINFDGPNGAAYITDLSNSSLGFSVGGSAVIESSNTVFGIGALSLPTNGDDFSSTVPPAGGLLDMSTGDFTVECWVNFSATGSSGIFLEDDNSNWFLRINGADIFATVANGGFTFIFSGVTPVANTWYHVALVRLGTTFNIAVNGAWGSSPYTGSGANGTVPGHVKITGVSGAALLMDEVRTTKGVARYTPGTPFTPPTAAFGTSCDAPLDDYNFAQVSLLMHMDGSQGSTTFTDSSNAANVFAIASGSPVIDDNVPRFGTGAFSTIAGAGAAIQTPVSGSITPTGPLDLSTGDFTIEFWVNLDIATTSTQLISCTDGSTNGWFIESGSSGFTAGITQSGFPLDFFGPNVIVAGKWQQVVFVNQGGIFGIAVDGVWGTTHNSPGSLGTPNMPLVIGPGGNGVFFDEIRITKGFARYTPGTNFIPPTIAFAGSAPGCDPYWSDVSLLVNFDGTNGSTTFTDLSTNAFAITNILAATVSTANPKFGSGAILPVSGSGAGGLQIPASGPPAAAGPLDLSVGDFTVECWAWTTAPSTAQGMASCFNGGSDGWKIQLANAVPGFSVHIYTGSPQDVIGPSPGSSVTANTWYHVAFVRQGNNFGLAVNGVFGTTLVNANSLGTPTSPLYFGTGETDVWDGFVDEMRITKGVARYSPGTNFTPPNAAFGMSCAFATVPNVIGQPLATAETNIVNADLVVGTVTMAYDPTIPIGDVVSTNPVAGTVVADGSSVDIVESLGPSSTVPNVVGLSLATGEADIVAADLVVGTVTTAPSLTVPAGDIISSSPVAGSVVASGSSVDLVESTGPLVVPNVVGEVLATAESDIVSAGLTVGTVTSQQSLAEPYGDVFSQSPVGGTPASEGDPVDLLWATSYSTPVLSGSIPNPLSQPRTVVLTWTESVFGITPAPGYDIRRNGVTIALVGAVLTYTDTVPSPGAYTYTVAGYDPGVPGDVSFQSNAVPIISAGSVVGFPNFINDEAIFGGYFGGQLNLVEFTYMPGRTPFVQGATNLIINRYKQEPTDVRQRGIDFSQFVVPGEILQTAALAGISAQGVLQQDTNPLVTPLVVDNILIDPVTNLKVGYTVSGGQNGIEYTVQFATTTNIQAQTLEEIFSINILIEDMFP